jgi:hypothetical protein
MFETWQYVLNEAFEPLGMIVRISNWPGSVSGYNGIVQPADCRPRHAYFRDGSLAEITARPRHVRFSPDSGHSSPH